MHQYKDIIRADFLADGSVDCGTVRFKTEDDYNEFFSGLLYKPVIFAVLAVASFVNLFQDSDTVVTEVHRTDAERRFIYRNDPLRINVIGAHERWEAVDLRSWNIKEGVIQYILDYFSMYFKAIGITIIYHKVKDNVYHFHIQRRIV